MASSFDFQVEVSVYVYNKYNDDKITLVRLDREEWFQIQVLCNDTAIHSK
jgi:hypothetical protein